MIKYLAKASDEEISHCKCADALAATPGQLDCPWCGCGWMICCTRCSKAFVFARVVEVASTYEKLVSADLRGRGHKPDTERKRDVARWMQAVMEDFDVGDVVVYLDGNYFRLDSTDIDLEGLYSLHKFERLPHAQTLDEPGYLRRLLGEPNYWRERERPDRHASD